MEEPGFASVPLLILDDASIGKGDQADARSMIIGSWVEKMKVIC